MLSARLNALLASGPQISRTPKVSVIEAFSPVYGGPLTGELRPFLVGIAAPGSQRDIRRRPAVEALKRQSVNARSVADPKGPRAVGPGRPVARRATEPFLPRCPGRPGRAGRPGVQRQQGQQGQEGPRGPSTHPAQYPVPYPLVPTTCPYPPRTTPPLGTPQPLLMTDSADTAAARGGWSSLWG